MFALTNANRTLNTMSADSKPNATMKTRHHMYSKAAASVHQWCARCVTQPRPTCVIPPRLTRPSSVVRLSVVVIAASLACGIVGGFGAGPLLGIDRLEAFFLWTASEAVNYAIFLPLVMGGRLVKVLKGSVDESACTDGAPLTFREPKTTLCFAPTENA